ncbi:MAG: ATP-dependent DNA ligase [Acidiphilium sp. 37-64-53]|uniref:cisplatin damage response ATP-dependent DNA ligase n=1 Tax=Acidiphilium TaxID=522 RepID=UPI000BCDCE08|nr:MULTISPECIES: cisplatin damage response ATP-dependent DNA ligase [Acidiphilium]OYW03608.1 MAG: ATP-dependent DNA ligase [Acidiphilium sp. 37-64-53]OZB29706.1 MAG: ATP-dependent DNA ligase [Acidiphilium sp. 34-64-41]HQT84302.1 cisplatin damage response ATP-dependent DNA ligase [Acidiphilium rubrum]
MKPFADLLERLLYTQGRNAKIALLADYFGTRPDPERGYALAAIAGKLDFPGAKPAALRALVATRVDPELFALSYDYVGDLAEAIALIWPKAAIEAPPELPAVVDQLRQTPRDAIPALIATWLDASDVSTRIALIKLITGGLRVGASLRLAKLALAQRFDVEVDQIEEIWHGLLPPYPTLFDWLERRALRPDPGTTPVFRPPMLAHPIEEVDRASLDWSAYRAEWKWDGIRVQLVATPGGKRLYSRGADDISASFPEILAAMEFNAVLDGELLVMRDGVVAPFADLQQRLNRKIVSAKARAEYPVAVRLYDMLFDGAADLRGLPFDQRRARLEAWFAATTPARMDISPQIDFETEADLAGLRATARDDGIEGLMLKAAASPYLAGRPKGHWWKWKRDPLSLDCVLMYAQRGHGRRSSFYSDYTFGVWTEEGRLVPIGKAYSGYTDAELLVLDKWIRTHTVATYGPVREVEHGIVLEIGFDAAQRSSRHKSGIALRFPRILRLRLDKPVAEADRLETATRLIGAAAV